MHSCYDSRVNLIHVPPNDPEYHNISEKFLNGWKHAYKVVPTIKRIFYIAYGTAEGLQHLANFSEYSNRVGNVEMLFHGTQRVCSIGETTDSVTVCTSQECNLCNIVRGSYDMEKAKGKRMFGSGIYSTQVSSKADEYSGNADPYVHTRVMILNQVALGRSKIMYEASHEMQHAPPMYNSVTGATYPEGGKLNYHEAVVYREDAICANAIVVYS
ncbi:ADP-ribosylation [Pholiota conissans]|uniref:ADP-ribosylation n=1 Tax=Pholiota conissans TaxID=109636 RepID=A0A9P5YV95_9AGAR|nr:ADP-ribosylation [Pholiota conissans]